MISLEHKRFVISNKLESKTNSNIYVKYKNYYCSLKSEDGYPLEILICFLCDILFGLNQQRVFFIEDTKDIHAIYPNTLKKNICLNKENKLVLTQNLNRIILSQKNPPLTINVNQNIKHTQVVNSNLIKKAISSLPKIRNKKKENLNTNIFLGAIISSFLINSLFTSPFVDSLNQEIINQKNNLKQEYDSKSKSIKLLIKNIKDKKLLQENYITQGNKINEYVDKYQTYLNINKKSPKKMLITNGVISYYDK